MSSTDFTLYSYYRSSASYRVRIALNIKGISFEYRAVHLVKEGGEQLGDSYKSINPSAEVPTLIHGDKVLSQSMAICHYLDDHSQGAPLLFSEDSFEKAKIIQACEIINAGIQPLQNLRVLKKLVKDYGFSEQQKNEWTKHWITLGFQGYESLIQKFHGNYSFGNRPTAADAFLMPQVYNAHRFNVDLSPFPAIQRVENTCKNQQSFIDAHPDNQPDTPE